MLSKLIPLVLNIIRWSFGILCLLWALIFINRSIYSTIGFALSALLLIPPLSKRTFQIVKKQLSLKLKVVLLAIFLFLGFSTAPKYESEKIKSNNISPTAIESVELTVTESPISPLPTINTQTYKVVRVIDGDTVDVNISGKTERIRVIGMDSPETIDPKKTVQCFGREAYNNARELLNNKNIKLEDDPTQGDKDSFGRLLRYIFLDNDLNFSLYMISEGFAHEYTYQIPYKYQKEFKEAQRKAEKAGKGLWNTNACVTPTKIATPTISSPTQAQSQYQFVPQTQPTTPPNNNGSSGYACDCNKSCNEISSCGEAQYQLNNCGCSARDGDHDGTACDGAPLGCQN